MHGFRGAGALAGGRTFSPLGGLGIALLTLAVLACASSADPRTIEGALARAADALSRRDGAALFRVIDQRARFAMDSTVKARRAAAEIIRKSYPPVEQARALDELGDAAQVQTSAELFARRCDDACLDTLSQAVGAPVETRVDGAVTVVRTTRGGELRMFLGDDQRWGIEWNTEALSRERSRAAAELELVKKNAELYEKQKTLQ